MELTIGRESSTAQSIGGRLHIVSSSRRSYYIGVEGSVPKTVSRQHCTIVVADDGGTMTIINLKPANLTFVNGIQIVSKTVTAGDEIELGSGRYRLDLKAVLDTVAGEMVRTHDISHLRPVWERYQKERTDIQIRQNKSSAIQSITGVLSMASILCGFIPGIPVAPRVILYVTAFILVVAFFVYRLRHAGEYVLQMNELEERFHREYVCPNPDCRRFLGNIPYDDLVRQSKSCYVCRCQYIDSQSRNR